MALDQLLGPKIQLTLNIKEGHGFGFLTCPIMVSASLKGQVIETDIVQPSPNPDFSTQLVWETDKKKIKRLRCENTVLKIDCKQIENKRSERIGYIFINLKQAQIVPRGKQATDMWVRLLGICKEARSLSPELFLSLAIEDIPESISATVPQCLPLPDTSNQDAKSTKSSTTVGFMIMPVYHEDEGTIQLGPDTPLSEIFLFTIQIFAVNNLKVMIPEDTEVKEGPYIIYSLMGHSVKSQSLSGYEQGLNKIDNRVVIRVRSTVLMLSAYFKQSPDAELKLTINDNRVLGNSSVHLQKLVPSEDFATICNKFGKHNSRYIETRCHIIQNNEADLVPTEGRAYIDVIVRLSYENKQPKNKQKTAELPDSKESQCTTPASRGDEDNRIDDVEVKDANEPLTIPPLELPSSQHDSESNSPPDNMTYRANGDGKPLTSYVLMVVINSIVVNKLPESGTLEFRFLHSGTDITNPAKQKYVISAVNEKINLPFAEAQLYFSSPADLVDNFLESNPIKITLYDKTVIFATFELNLSKAQKEDSICLPLESNKDQKGFIYVSVLIRERKHQPSSPGSEQSTSVSTQCNEEVLEKIVSELEDWKEKQQQIFQDELEEKEKQHLAKIEEDWLAHKKTIEKALLEQVENNKKMTETLTSALTNLKLREDEIEEKEIQLENSKDALESKYNIMYQELREASKHLHEDVNSKLQRMKEENSKLEKNIASLESDNTKLLKAIEGLRIQIQDDRTQTLSKETESLLKQTESLRSRLDAEIQSKNFFKEQWGKAVRELHMLKPKYEAVCNVERLKETEETRNDILFQTLHEEEQAMKQDQKKLKALRSELFTQHKSQDNTGAPIVLTRANSCSDTFKQKNMVEKLIQQRNEMLLAGDSLYESHVQRMNQQISFLMRSQYC